MTKVAFLGCNVKCIAYRDRPGTIWQTSKSDDEKLRFEKLPLNLHFHVLPHLKEIVCSIKDFHTKHNTKTTACCCLTFYKEAGRYLASNEIEDYAYVYAY